MQGGDWKQLDTMVREFQQGAQLVRRAPFPVVAAPFGLTLGGGAEYAPHADRIQAHAELYMGLVEAGVGLIPAGGGTKERSSDSRSSWRRTTRPIRSRA